MAKVNEDIKRIKGVGEIVVKIYKGGEAKESTRGALPMESLGMGSKVHEKALKGDPKSHSTS